MNWLTRWALRLGLVAQSDVYARTEVLAPDCLVIPSGVRAQGSLRTDVEIVVAGRFDGSLCIVGSATIRVLAGGMVSGGVLSADTVRVQGELHHATVDANHVQLEASALVAGRSTVRYARLLTDPQASLNGLLEKRAQPREPWELAAAPSNGTQAGA